MSLSLKQTEKFMYNWTNRTVQEFVKAILPESTVPTTQAETKAVVAVTPSANVVLTTTANKTIFNLGAFTYNNLPNVNITLGNPGQQQVGDLLILIANPDTTNGSITMNFSNDFYITKGSSSVATSLSFSSSRLQRLASIFVYDGQKFVNSADNY